MTKLGLVRTQGCHWKGPAGCSGCNNGEERWTGRHIHGSQEGFCHVCLLVPSLPILPSLCPLVSHGWHYKKVSKLGSVRQEEHGVLLHHSKVRVYLRLHPLLQIDNKRLYSGSSEYDTLSELRLTTTLGFCGVKVTT
jgi:hypothetical protein